MKRLLILFAILLCCTQLTSAQVPKSKHPIAEVKHTAQPIAAPKECLMAFREFFSYVQKKEPDIVRDEQARQRWLTQRFRQELMDKFATFKEAPDENPYHPDNQSFIGAWDYPSTYSIVASRRYGNRAIIDVLYKWGPGTNYPGDERTSSFIFLLEEGKWKLDDIYTFGGTFAEAESLSQYFRGKEK